MSLFTTLPDELIFKIVSYFQGYSRRRQHIIERARDANTYDFLQIMMRERKLLGASGLKTDVKSIISFAETHPIFYQLIRKSNLGKIIWVNYYNSLFPLEIKENSIHIGPKRFPSCTNGPRCTNVLHYTNNERTGPVNWSIDSLFKKISVRSFVLMKNEAPDFTGNHQMTLDHAEIELARVLENIEKFKKTQTISLTRIR